MVGFADASEKGYAAVVYLQVTDAAGTRMVHFVTAKSKVAPLKVDEQDKGLSIPRLELYGALLLAQTIYDHAGSYNDR